MKAKLLQGFYLGDLFVEPLKGSVTGRDFSEHLSPDAVEVLLRLAHAPGAVVTRKTLLEKVWGAGHGDEGSLDQAISEVRAALHDTAENSTFIQTVPGRGYRLALEPTFPGAEESGAGLDEPGFFQNVRQRGVLEAALAYLVSGWLLLQVAEIHAPLGTVDQGREVALRAAELARSLGNTELLARAGLYMGTTAVPPAPDETRIEYLNEALAGLGEIGRRAPELLGPWAIDAWLGRWRESPPPPVLSTRNRATCSRPGRHWNSPRWAALPCWVATISAHWQSARPPISLRSI